ncbi:restriction endonuclease subunit S [Neobacillus soli]|uniref:restriction endonuclease subunit S n=1 Tax=Neobacillus soli TaxID=220688 RepID=UPI0008255DD3|nr:restriction endonuclease subunit S [Neobacillus soli]
MSYKTYELYKDSGVEWIGKIPKHWVTKRAKYIFKELSIKNHPNEELLSVMKGKGLVPRKDVESGVVMAFKDLQNFKLVYPYQFVIHLRSFQSGFEMSKIRGIVSPAYSVFELRNCEDSPSFFKYLFYCETFINYISSLVLSLRDGKPISYQLFGNMLLFLPPKNEQINISDFLDNELSKIDFIVNNKQKQVDTLKKYRQSLINETVLRGLNPSTKAKDSGMKWIGKIPEHWDLVRLKYLAINKSDSFVDGPFGSDLKTEHYTEYGVPIIQLNNLGDGVHINKNTKFTSEEKADSLKRSNTFPGDIVITKMMPVARAAIVNYDYDKYLISSDCIKFLANEKIVDKKFIIYSINARYFRINAESYSTGSTRLRTNLSLVKNFKIVFPPKEEQIEIANYLDRTTHEIDETVLKINEQIEILKKYRQSIIYEAITGKIDVRNYKKQNMEVKL